MAQVLDFPVKKLPEEIEVKLFTLAQGYIGVLNYADTLVGKDATEEELESLYELIAYTFMTYLNDAIDSMGQEPS